MGSVDPRTDLTTGETMETEEIRAPVLWRRPHAKIYSYNQEVSGNFYQPMIDYVDTKDRQGIFFERPKESISLPGPGEQCLRKHVISNDVVSGVYRLDRCLVNAYSQQTKEMNGATGIFFLPLFYTFSFITNIFLHFSPVL